MVTRLAPPDWHPQRGTAARSPVYGAWKGLGHTLGPLLGGGVISLGGFTALFAALAVLAVAVAVPSVLPLPSTRQTMLDLARR